MFTLTRDQRDALHAAAIAELADVGDLYLALQNEDFQQARQMAFRYGPILRLMHWLGWDRLDGRDVIELHLSPIELTAVAERLAGVTLGFLGPDPGQQAPDAERTEYCATVLGACCSLLVQAARRGQRAPLAAMVGSRP